MYIRNDVHRIAFWICPPLLDCYGAGKNIPLSEVMSFGGEWTGDQGRVVGGVRLVKLHSCAQFLFVDANLRQSGCRLSWSRALRREGGRPRG